MFVYSLRNRTALSVFRGPNTYYTDSRLHGVAQTGNTSHNHAIYFSNWFKDEERYNYKSQQSSDCAQFDRTMHIYPIPVL